MALRADAAKMRRGVKCGGSLGRIAVRFDSLPSTNETAKTLAARGAPEGVVVSAGRQTGGKGRMGRRWESPKGGLWMSVILRPKGCPGAKAASLPLIPLLAGVSVARALREEYKIGCSLKWPNDVLASGRKICGILAESSFAGSKVSYIILGIGVNVNNPVPRALSKTATSVRRESHIRATPERLMAAVLQRLSADYADYCRKPESVVSKWLALSETVGKDVRVETGGRPVCGRAAGIAENGALVVETAAGKRAEVLAGDCQLLE